MSRPQPDLRVRWSRRSHALIYEGSTPTGGMLAHLLEGLKIIDLYDQRHGIGARIHRPDESDERTIAQELDARGYDLTTLRFSIRRKVAGGP